MASVRQRARAVRRRYADAASGRTVGRAAVLALLAGALAALVIEARARTPPRWDVVVLHALARHKHDSGPLSLRSILQIPIDPTVELVGAVLVAVFVVAMATRKRLGGAIFVSLSFIGALLLTITIKDLVARRALDPSDSGYSFPSGHALASMAVVVSLSMEASTKRWRVAAIACGTVCAGWLGAAMVYDGWHWPSDVVGGWLIAVTWVVALDGAARALGLRCRRPGSRSARTATAADASATHRVFHVEAAAAPNKRAERGL